MESKQDGGTGGGSLGTGTYDNSGNLTGPDSPAGADAQLDTGDGQGDDLANRLGGGAGRGTGMTGGGAVTGDAGAERSETTDAPALSGFAPDAGSPGGMGGSHGTGKTAGGVSPIQPEREEG